MKLLVIIIVFFFILVNFIFYLIKKQSEYKPEESITIVLIHFLGSKPGTEGKYLRTFNRTSQEHATPKEKSHEFVVSYNTFQRKFWQRSFPEVSYSK